MDILALSPEDVRQYAVVVRLGPASYFCAIDRRHRHGTLLVVGHVDCVARVGRPDDRPHPDIAISIQR